MIIFRDGDRVVVTGGQYAGRHGRLVRSANVKEWVVKLDDFMRTVFVNVNDLRHEDDH
jgi:ribosomal protein L24